jgi:superkiller protein 8
LAVTPTQILSSSGASSLKVHNTTEPDFPIAQSVEDAHKIGCHHVVTSRSGTKAVSVGFGGEIKAWLFQDGIWVEDRETTSTSIATFNPSSKPI